MSIAKWRPHIEACEASGMSKSAYAKQHNIDYKQLIYWYKKYEQYNLKRNDLIRVKSPAPNLEHALTSNQQVLGIMEYPSGVKLYIHHLDLLQSLPDWRS